jgi:tubby-related protein 1
MDSYHIDTEQVVMQFGRMSENMFSCDFRYPLSFIQAFGIGLSAFETRLFRE